ncbi:DAHP synthetase [Pavlovales sp. CCMP2436]|nr:DAHP synthetase [Pavlovales sp. CCMP2436]
MSDAATIAARTWAPGSWRVLESQQMAEYEDKVLEASVIAKLSKLPPLVQPSECDALKALLAKAAAGEAFIVQGGDCAERFIDCEAERLEAQLKVLVQMGAIVSEATGVPPVVIARIAGQYGKPRSKPTEVVEGHGEIMSFKGDNINGYEPEERKWDPKRLLEGYYHSASTLNYLRSLRMSADLSKFFDLDVGFTSKSATHAQNIQVAAGVKKSAGATTFYTAHEAMQLNLEEALTRPVGDAHYNLSAHMVWIGDRTRQMLGGHVEYFRGIANPIGVKVGPSMKNDELAELVAVLNPNKEAGKLVIITRYGHDKVEQYLPGHIAAVKATGIPVVWQCDGVHGNTITAKSVGLKTRAFDDIMAECTNALAVHRKAGSILAGIHLELTGQETVTECTGGCVCVTEEDLKSNYETWCDPRLNYKQALEAAFTMARELGPICVETESKGSAKRTRKR